MRYFAVLLCVFSLAFATRAPGREPGEARSIGSPEVPLDSWVYPALDRLAAFKLIDTHFLGLRPWTRLECASLTLEAGESIASYAEHPGARTYAALRVEFHAEIENLQSDISLTGMELHSVYVRGTHIAGTPLNDSYHFGQTVVNDFGRPYGEGSSVVTGFQSFAAAGPVHVRFRGEYQHAPSFAGYPQAVMETLAPIDRVDALPSYAHPDVNRFEILDAVAGINHNGWDFSFGKQSLWWGPGRAGPMLFSNNARPIAMVRISRTTPMLLPGFLKHLGPARVEMFMGRLAGHHFPRAPYIHGQKLVLKPTRDLEFGFSRTTVVAGEGRPLTLRRFLVSWFSIDEPTDPTIFNDPGDRHGGFDFTYRVPGLRDKVTLYGDLFTDDDPSPLGWAFHRSGGNFGLYLPQLPKLANLDLRLEGVYTDAPGIDRFRPGQFFYTNAFYPDSYTNNRQIIGSWVGRQGIGLQGWSTYWFSPEKTLQFSFRRHGVTRGFIPGGGNLLDFSIVANTRFKQDLELNVGLQFERWRFPLLAAGAEHNVRTSFGITYYPRFRLRPGRGRSK